MKKIYIMGLISLILVLMVGIAYAVTCDFTTTATTAGTASTYLKGNAVNISVNMTGNVGLIGNVSTAVLTVAKGTINGTIVNNVTVGEINDSNLSNFDYINFTVGTNGMPDDSSVVYTATLKNNSQQTEATCTRSFITDNTVPVFASNTPASDALNTTKDIDFGIACNNASSAILYINNGEYTMTESGDNCTYSSLKLVNSGKHSWHVTASDGLNTTTSPTYTFELRLPGGVVYDQRGQVIVSATTGAIVSTGGERPNAVVTTINKIFETVFAIFNSIFSIFKKG